MQTWEVAWRHSDFFSEARQSCKMRLVEGFAFVQFHSRVKTQTSSWDVQRTETVNKDSRFLFYVKVLPSPIKRSNETFQTWCSRREFLLFEKVLKNQIFYVECVSSSFGPRPVCAATGSWWDHADLAPCLPASNPPPLFTTKALHFRWPPLPQVTWIFNETIA